MMFKIILGLFCSCSLVLGAATDSEEHEINYLSLAKQLETYYDHVMNKCMQHIEVIESEPTCTEEWKNMILNFRQSFSKVCDYAKNCGVDPCCWGKGMMWVLTFGNDVGYMMLAQNKVGTHNELMANKGMYAAAVGSKTGKTKNGRMKTQ